jgi:anti-sigma factor ChrR (cupin superfamily)
MKHEGASVEMTEMAALYALGALSQHEARAFEGHLAECDDCKTELESFEETVAVLSVGDEQEPPPGVRDRLIGSLNGGPAGGGEDRGPAGEIASVHAGEGDWTEISAGIRVKTLNFDKVSGLVTALVKMMPGTSLPMHRHQGVEQFFVLEGDCNVHGERLGPGDFHRALPGSVHRDTYTVEGTLLLLIAPQQYEVLSTL